MLFDTLKMSCEKLAEKDSEFKFQLQSFIQKNSSVNGLVNEETVKSLYDMILDHARSYLTVKAEAAKALAEKQNTDGCFICGSKDHWYNDCPKAEERKGVKGQPGKGGGKYQVANGAGNYYQQQQQPGKGKAKGQPKGQGKGQPPAKQQGDAQKGKGKGVKKGKGKGGNKGKGKGYPQAKECQVEEEYPTEEDQ